MKLKFINLLLASVLLIGSAQVFTSCKDNEADLYTNLKAETISLSERLTADEALLKTLRNDLDAEIAARKAADQNLQNQIDALVAKDADLQTQLNNLKANSATKEEVAALQALIDTNKANIADLYVKVANNASDIEDLKLAIIRIDGTIAALEGRVNDAFAAIDALTAAMNGLDGKIDGVAADLADLTVLVNSINDSINDPDNGILARLTAAESAISTIQNTLTNLNDRVADLENKLADWDSILPEIANNASTALALANSNANEIEILYSLIESLKGQVGDNADASDAAIQKLEGMINEINSQLGNFATREELAYAVSALQAQALKYYQQSISHTLYMVSALRMYVDNQLGLINMTVGDMQNNLSDLENRIKNADPELFATLRGIISTEITEAIEALNDRLSQDIANKYDVVMGWINGVIIPDLQNLRNDLGALQTTMTTNYNELKGDIATLTEEVEGIKEAIKAVKDQVNELADRVTGIIIQQTDNEVLGTLNIPVGITSSMLLAYICPEDQVVEPGRAQFPTSKAARAYDGTDAGVGITSAQLNDIYSGSKEVNVDGGIVERDENGDAVLGKVYLTINPANVDISNKTFAIVKSNGEVLPINIKPVPSNAELNFGYTRDAANGFYEAEATIPVNKIGSIYFTLNDNFKSTVQNILKEAQNSIKSVAKPSTIASLAKAVYNQINGVLPALAIECSWAESAGNNVKVTSTYGLAAAAFKPLSLKTLTALDGTLRHIPNIPDLGKITEKFDAWYDALVGQLNINIYDPNDPFTLTIGDITVHISVPTVSFDGVNTDVEVPLNRTTLTFPLKVNVIDDAGNVIGTVNQDVTTTISDTDNPTVDLSGLLGEMESAVNTALQEALGSVGDDIAADINAQLTTIKTQIETKVNDLLSSLQTQVDDAFETIKNFVDSKLNALENRLGRYTDRLQAIIDRINSVLDEPSYYVQPILLYSVNGNIATVSSTWSLPTIINTNLNEIGLTVIPTTWTLETVVPLYQKYVAVTRAWSNATGTINDAARAARATANGEDYVNEVVDSQRHNIALRLQKGYTYEIIYQGLDYYGLVSGKKYYVRVQ